MTSEQWILFMTQDVISVGSLNRQVLNSLFYLMVGITSCQVNTTTSKQRIVCLVSLNWLCPYYFWIDGCPNSIHLCSP